MSKAVEDVAHSREEREDQKFEEGMNIQKYAMLYHTYYHCKKNLVQPKLGCPSYILASSLGLNHLLCFVPKKALVIFTKSMLT